MPIDSISGNAATVAWICFGLGVIVVLGGLYLGIRVAPKEAAKNDAEKLDKAKKEIEELTAELKAAQSGNHDSLAQAATASVGKAEAAKSILEEVSGLVASLPEFQRFSGMLVLIGAVLMGVGTVQFGGTSLF